MSDLKEVIRTSGDIRRTLAQAMIDIRTGDLDISRGQVMAQLAKEINSSLQVEVNIAKTRKNLLESGKSMGDVTQLGRMIIEDDGSVPTLRG